MAMSYPGKLKNNVDEAVSFQTNVVAIGGVVRDSNGLAISCFNDNFGFESPLFVEPKAILHGLKQA